jgi:hypothetical protein
LERDGRGGDIMGGLDFRVLILGSKWLPGSKWAPFLGSFWLYLGSFWVRFLTIVNKDGQSLGSFFQKNIFAGQEPCGSDK